MSIRRGGFQTRPVLFNGFDAHRLIPLITDVTHVGGQKFPLAVNRGTRILRIHTATKLLGACRRGWQAAVYGGP